MPLFAEHIPKYRRKLVGLEGKAHIAGPFDDKILWFTDFREAREVSLDVGGEHRDTCTCKSLSHHLQRDGFSGSGSTGDEAMAICKPKRQPRRLLALSDENFLVGIGHLAIGGSHCIASSHASGVSAARHHDHTASCKPIETGQRRAAEWQAAPVKRPGSCELPTKVGTNVLTRDNLLRISRRQLH